MQNLQEKAKGEDKIQWINKENVGKAESGLKFSRMTSVEQKVEENK